MRTIFVATLAAAALVLPAGQALAAPGVPQRPAGPVVPVQESENGGDNGWGNCGHNSSGGNPHTGFNGEGGGNGGYKKGDECGHPGGGKDKVGQPDTDEPTEPSEPTSPSEPTDPSEPTEPSPIGAA